MPGGPHIQLQGHSRLVGSLAPTPSFTVEKAKALGQGHKVIENLE